jgi:hypothetical protein
MARRRHRNRGSPSWSRWPCHRNRDRGEGDRQVYMRHGSAFLSSPSRSGRDDSARDLFDFSRRTGNSGSHRTRRWSKPDSNSRSRPDGELRCSSVEPSSRCVGYVDRSGSRVTSPGVHGCSQDPARNGCDALIYITILVRGGPNRRRSGPPRRDRSFCYINNFKEISAVGSQLHADPQT